MMLSDVCLSRKSGLSREQRGLGRIGREVAHVTRDSDTTFKVKTRSRSQGVGHIVAASRTACRKSEDLSVNITSGPPNITQMFSMALPAMCRECLGGSIKAMVAGVIRPIKCLVEFY